MKKSCVFKAAAVCLLAVTLAGCSLLTDSRAGGKIPASSRRTVEGTIEELRQKYTGYGFKALKDETEQRLYAGIDEAVHMMQSEEFFAGDIDDTDRVTDIIELYKDDHPEVFWIDEAEPYYYSQDSEGMTVQIHFKLEGLDLRTARDAFDSVVQQALKNAPWNGSEYEREMYVHDLLILNCVYDDEAVELHKSSKVRANEQSAYGALVEGKAVCEGYTRAFQLLCGKLGVNCWVIQGQAQNFADEEGTVNHIWNCVQLDGNWYHVDVTWDDYEDAPATTDRYYYFNLTTQELLKDHIISPLYGEGGGGNVWCNAYVPECNSTEYYYFARNALQLSDLDDEGNAAFLATTAKNNRSSCCYHVSVESDFDWVFNEMVRGYAYEWVEMANEINGYEPVIGTNCKLSSNSDRRIITLIIDYAGA